MAKKRVRMAFLLVLGLSFACVTAHNITQLEVPMYADPRLLAELTCRYRMEIEPPLHSVKWYRDGHEIFRYTPAQEPSTRHFNVSGLEVTNSACNAEVCTIYIVPPRAGPLRAAYTCEVGTEGPRFAVVKQTKLMTVAALLEKDPVITGLPAHSVLPGDELRLNCTSEPSLPAADIVWFVDGEQEKLDAWQPSKTEVSKADAYGMRTSWRALPLRLGEAAAARGHVALRCEATLRLQPPHTRSRSAQVTVARTPPHLSKYTSNGTPTPSSGSLAFVVVVWTIRAFCKASAFSEPPRKL